jgi:flagellar protein FliS
MNSLGLQQQAQMQYQRMQAQTASPGQLVIMLYQGALRFIGRAKAGLQARDYDASRVNLLKAQDIVAELMASLDMGVGEISDNLMRLYEYMHRRLIDANIRRDEVAATEVEELLRSLLPAWQEAVRIAYAGGAAAAPVVGTADRFVPSFAP